MEIKDMKPGDKILMEAGGGEHYFVKENNGCWALYRRQKVWLKEPTMSEVAAEVDIEYSAPVVGADEESFKPSGDFIKGF